MAVRSRWPSTLRVEMIWGLAVIIGVFAFVNTQPIRPNDFWWQLAVGKEISQTHQVPSVDTFSYTAFGRPYPAYAMFWLVELCYYYLNRAGGLALIIFSHSLVISLAYLLLLFTCRLLTRHWRISAFATLFAAVLGVSDWNVRAQGVALATGSLYLAGIYAYRKGKKKLWLAVFPLGMLVWANSHGTFVLGFVFLGLWLIDEVRMGLAALKTKKSWQVFKPALTPALVGGVSMLMVLINPAGLGIINYVMGMTKNSLIQNFVPEWAPPSFHSLEGTIFWFGFIICVMVVLLTYRHLSFFQWAMLVIFGGLAIKTSRGIIWFGLTAAPALAQSVSQAWDKRFTPKNGTLPVQKMRLNVAMVALLSLLGIISLPWFKNDLPYPAIKAGLISSETPVAATQYLLTHHLPGPVFNDLSYGSYLIWAGQPAYKVFIDPRLDLFPWNVWVDYITISQGENGWQERLDRYGVKTLFLSLSEETNLIRLAGQSEFWARVYQDSQAIIFIKE